MTKLEELREYLNQEIGNLVTVIYDRATGRLRIRYDGCWVCSIYHNNIGDDRFGVVFYDPFICRSVGYLSGVNLTGSEIPKAIKNRINICENDNRIDINVSDDKAIYMMLTRNNKKTQLISDLLRNKTVVYNGNIYTNIENVIFNNPATIVFWTDGSKTVVKCQPGETFDPEKGLAMAISKKVLGNDYGYYETFAKHVGRYNKKRFNKALEEAKKIPPDEITYNSETYVLKNKETNNGGNT